MKTRLGPSAEALTHLGEVGYRGSFFSGETRAGPSFPVTHTLSALSDCAAPASTLQHICIKHRQQLGLTLLLPRTHLDPPWGVTAEALESESLLRKNRQDAKRE